MSDTVRAFGYAFLSLLLLLASASAIYAIIAFATGRTPIAVALLFSVLTSSFLGIWFDPEDRTGKSRFQKWLRRVIHQKQTRVIQRLSLPRSVETPLLCITPRRDEAGRLLSTIVKLSDIPHRLWRLMLLIFALLFGCIGLFIPEPGKGSILPESIAPWYFVTLGLAFAILVILQGLMWLLPKLLRSHQIGFGRERGIENWLMKVATKEGFQDGEVEFIDIASETIATLNASSEPNYIKRFLRRRRHSLIYVDRIAITRIVTWVGQSANA